MLKSFMGLEQWDKTGLSVAESARRLHRIGYLDRKAMRLAAGRMIGCPEYEIKGALARHVWLDAVHHDQLRGRCRQLRMSSAAFDKCPDPLLQTLMDGVHDAPGTLALLQALFEVVKPAQLAAIRRYLDEAQPLVDWPTRDLLRHQLLDREDQLAWGREALEALRAGAAEDDLVQADRYAAWLTALIEAANGVDGLDQSASTDRREPSFDAQTNADNSAASTERPDVPAYTLPAASTRDSRFTTSPVKFDGIDMPDSDEGRFKMMLYSRYFEMSPAEGVAYVLYEANEGPWAFCLDAARHLWDEVRHSWFGEAALRKLGYDVYAAPNWTGFYEVCRNELGADDAYLHLTIAIEQAAMKYPPGKREEWEFARDIARDPLMTTFQDFDWADEVVHAGFGKKWVIETRYSGNTSEAIRDADVTWDRRQRYLERCGGNGANSSFAGDY